ncbi:MAG: hypothetical protein J0H68_04845 [Sphingobacteriia bacterium]|nr:hypothetical protein [Sphingobacteriia bacterium]
MIDVRKCSYILIIFLLIFINANSSPSAIFHFSNDSSFKQIQQDEITVRNLIYAMLKRAGYTYSKNNYKVIFKQRGISAIITTNKGKKFIKLVEKEAGKNEFFNGSRASHYLPVIQSEALVLSDDISLLVQPYIEEIKKDKGVLIDVIAEIENNENKKESYYPLFKKIFEQMYGLTTKTLHYKIAKAKNDEFYFHRVQTQKLDNVEGRLESFYTMSKVKLDNEIINWHKLVKKKWVIDGVAYKETLEDLILKAHNNLNPANKRLIALSHGDWHEMNIITDILDNNKLNFYYIDLETFGENSILGDSVIYLVYNSILADYINPKYYSNYLNKRNKAINFAMKTFSNKEIHPAVIVSEKYVYMDNVNKFGTNKVRKEIANLHIKLYLEKVIKLAEAKYGLSIRNEIEEYLKSCFLLRLLGVYNLTEMEPNDQVKLLGLIYKVIGTTENNKNIPFTERFLDAI